MSNNCVTLTYSFSHWHGNLRDNRDTRSGGSKIFNRRCNSCYVIVVLTHILIVHIKFYAKESYVRRMATYINTDASLWNIADVLRHYSILLQVIGTKFLYLSFVVSRYTLECGIANISQYT